MINPIRIYGLWDEGYALDLYTLSSTYIGEDAFGHSRFNNTYSEVGHLLYQFKYNGHLDTREQIAAIAVEFLRTWLKGKDVDSILPCPASMMREIQPVYAIAYEISELMNIAYTDEVLKKDSTVVVKNTAKEARNLEGLITKVKPAKRPCSILLIDDIVDTGSTANECVRLLKQDPNIQHVYFLAIAKRRRGSPGR